MTTLTTREFNLRLEGISVTCTVDPGDAGYFDNYRGSGLVCPPTSMAVEQIDSVWLDDTLDVILDCWLEQPYYAWLDGEDDWAKYIADHLDDDSAEAVETTRQVLLLALQEVKKDDSTTGSSEVCARLESVLRRFCARQIVELIEGV